MSRTTKRSIAAARDSRSCSKGKELEGPRKRASHPYCREGDAIPKAGVNVGGRAGQVWKEARRTSHGRQRVVGKDERRSKR